MSKMTFLIKNDTMKIDTPKMAKIGHIFKTCNFDHFGQNCIYTILTKKKTHFWPKVGPWSIFNLKIDLKSINLSTSRRISSIRRSTVEFQPDIKNWPIQLPQKANDEVNPRPIFDVWAKFDILRRTSTKFIDVILSPEARVTSVALAEG